MNLILWEPQEEQRTRTKPSIDCSLLLLRAERYLSAILVSFGGFCKQTSTGEEVMMTPIDCEMLPTSLGANIIKDVKLLKKTETMGHSPPKNKTEN